MPTFTGMLGTPHSLAEYIICAYRPQLPRLTPTGAGVAYVEVVGRGAILVDLPPASYGKARTHTIGHGEAIVKLTRVGEGTPCVGPLGKGRGSWRVR